MDESGAVKGFSILPLVQHAACTSQGSNHGSDWHIRSVTSLGFALILYSVSKLLRSHVLLATKTDVAVNTMVAEEQLLYRYWPFSKSSHKIFLDGIKTFKSWNLSQYNWYAYIIALYHFHLILRGRDGRGVFMQKEHRKASR